MTPPIRTALAEMAERAPHLPLPTGIYERARKRQRRQRILAAVAAVLFLAAGAALNTVVARTPITPSQGDGIDDMPARVVKAPYWTASVEDAPLPRALVAFADWEGGDITLVGPHDRYRIYETGGDRGRRVQSRPALSPDGRFLLTDRGLLEVTTGVTRPLGTDVPLAFSPDSRLILLARYESTDDVRGEIRAVDLATGGLVWTLPLEPGPMPRDVQAAVSPDGSRIAVQRHADMAVYDAKGRLLWKQPINGDLAGQRAFLMERRSLATVMPSRVCLYDTDTAVGQLCHDVADSNRPVRGQVTEVLGWDEGWPIVTVAPSVVSLQGAQTTLLEGPAGINHMWFASQGVRWSQREPGSPEPGPFVDRFRTPIKVLGVIALVVVLVAAAWRRRRGRRKATT